MNDLSKLQNHFNSSDFASMDTRYRTNFVNSLSGFKSANLIGTLSPEGISNLAIFSSAVHLGADPALVGFVNRPHTVERQTLENILATGSYTINHVSENFYQQAHQTAARYPAEVSEFDKAGLDEQYTEFYAPYVAQSTVKFGVKFIEKMEIARNKTVLVIGEIVEVICPPDVIEQDGKIDISQANSVAVSGLDEYHQTIKLARLPYAKPK